MQSESSVEMDVLSASMREADLPMEAETRATEPDRVESDDEDFVRVHSFRHPSLYDHKGSLICFETEEVEGHKGQLGIVRIPDMPHYHIPDYLEDKGAYLKSLALSLWKSYKLRTRSLVDGIEYFPEDFGLTYAVISMDPGSATPGAVMPVAALNFPNLIKPVNTTMRHGPHADEELWGYWIVGQFNFLPEVEKKNRLKRLARKEKLEGKSDGPRYEESAPREAPTARKNPEVKPAAKTGGPPQKPAFTKAETKPPKGPVGRGGAAPAKSSFAEAARQVAERRERSRSARRRPGANRESDSNRDWRTEAGSPRLESKVVKVSKGDKELYAPPPEERNVPTYENWRATNKKMIKKTKK